MPNDGSLLQATVVFLLAVVVLVPLAQRLKLGAVPGYLLAGILIGPSVLGLIDNPHNVARLSEMGVVMLLFVIGLELSPQRLWTMRRALFGVGSLQVGLTALVLGLLAWWLFGQPPATAAVLGLGLALSSTAFGLQVLAERNELGKPHGRLAVAILLFQDIAAIPLIALVPLLGGSVSNADEGGWPLLAVVLGIGVVVIAGRYLLRPVFRWTVGSGLHELSTATALFLVLGTAWVMEHVGVSMALGAFLAGVLMAESEFRHELESQIEPLKGLLLGLFFVGVGMTADLRLLASMPLQVAGLTLLLVAVKLPLLWGIGRLFGGLDRPQALCLAVVLASGGEFAFVVFKLGLQYRVLAPQVHDLLVLAITLSMALVPLVMMALARQLRPSAVVTPPASSPPLEDTPQVVIAGFGRLGRAVARMLHAEGVRVVALDASVEALARKARPRGDGPTVYYGDPSRSEILRAAKVEQAALVIVAADDAQANQKTVDVLTQLFPKVQVIAAARDHKDVLRLLDQGVSPVRETFHSSLEMARRAFIALGHSEAQAAAWVQRYRQQDEQWLLARHRQGGALDEDGLPAGERH
ncbi:monovalent cation:proton antiporter-2 (CPA2) family protein [Pseudomonas sp. UFMG81]|uniref:monovalent cation:proton antiporter-2 (CPA2) family protein n=1 Tax=Pseudomonas sp. UFMG81 TaxID=2745936 RepID=UPI00188EDE1B|nr:monovalent cation:proton antiporter-2 (CPA2) family protein [Pseudomonas sp. UFMG81]